jgi:hypothetical protein
MKNTNGKTYNHQDQYNKTILQKISNGRLLRGNAIHVPAMLDSFYTYARLTSTDEREYEAIVTYESDR